ncbi:O-antigen ligase family protein [Qipengyuania sphaerica]|uniref:O-antigen ligase family protein n=1 Tax=Qipengyuania sphaerica TaxID=2867243 RepID=UPI001C880322|nr:O-antigen ligase family protein [Qipengyuania sphaerica]MBX7540053.1 O-antigen ligase family protein [Qipengyuania sphaerica]
MIVAGFIACAMVLGGGGSPSPAAELAVQIAFAAALLLWVWWARTSDSRVARLPRLLFWPGAALLTLPLLQLVPLPPSVWQGLPQRELEEATLSLLGQDGTWRALSISPPVTLAGLLALIPAVGVMWATSKLGARDRQRLVLSIGFLALLGAFLGALQMASGPEAFRFYERSHRGWLTAFHANRNAAADVLLIGSLAFGSWYARTRADIDASRRRLPLFIAGQVVLLVALVLTGSRAGIALGGVALVFNWLMLRPADLDLRTRALFAGVAAVILGLLAMPLVLSGNSRLARVADRFDVTGDARIPLWRDSIDTLAGFWPAGSGVGTFPKAFQPFESFEYLDPAFPNRAHNDYLEFFIEAGLMAMPILLGGALAIIALARRAWKMSPEEHAVQLFAGGTLAVVALHSIVDYPLRNMAIACLAGVAAGLLTVTPRHKTPRSGTEGRDELL